VRWYLLVRTLHLPFRLRDAFRLGFLGYLFNFVAFGSVGGDLFKAVFIAREQPGRRTEAVATVIVDRVIGLYSLLVLASIAILVNDLPQPAPALAAICHLTYLATAVGGIFVLLLLTPGFTRGSMAEFLEGLPRVGTTFQQLIRSVRMYRSRWLTMGLILGMSMLVHGLLTIAIYLIATGLFAQAPPLHEHFIIVPLSNVAAGLPFTPAGLGSFEFAMEELYKYVPRGGAGDVAGVLVALAFRLITIAIAAVGVVYYWTSRRDVRRLLADTEQVAQTVEG
jgi:uncharacterized protein (TIRG00374 family)